MVEDGQKIRARPPPFSGQCPKEEKKFCEVFPYIKLLLFDPSTRAGFCNLLLCFEISLKIFHPNKNMTGDVPLRMYKKTNGRVLLSRQGGTMNNFNHPPKNLKLNSNSNWRFAKKNSTTRQIRQKFHFSGGGTIFTHFVFHSVGDLKHFWKSNGLDPYPWTIQGSCLGKGWLASTCARAGAPARSQAQ